MAMVAGMELPGQLLPTTTASIACGQSASKAGFLRRRASASDGQNTNTSHPGFDVTWDLATRPPGIIPDNGPRTVPEGPGNIRGG